MHKAAFVILHYETLSFTIECIESIVSKVRYPDLHVVVVDNGSSVHKVDTLKIKYAQNPGIHFIANKKNLGFAKGNNKGYRYARNILKAEFILVINNDTLIHQPDFVQKIVSRYEKGRYDILGPDIISLRDGSHQNPRKEILHDASVVRRFIRYFRVTLMLNYVFIDLLVLKVKKFFIPGSRLPTHRGNINPDNKEMEHVKLHGSAIVFSPDYVAGHEDAFYPETFLYCEESILYYLVKREGLVTVYYPDVKIYHEEDATSNYMISNELLKRRFILKHNIHSHKVLLKIIEES